MIKENVAIFNPYAIHNDDIERMRCRTTKCKRPHTAESRVRMVTNVRYAKGEDGTDRTRVYAYK